MGYTDDVPVVVMCLHTSLAKHLPVVLWQKTMARQAKQAKEARAKAVEDKANAEAEAAPKAKPKAAPKAEPKAAPRHHWKSSTYYY